MEFFKHWVFFAIISKIDCDCGSTFDLGRIIGGTQVETNKFPWYGTLVLKTSKKVNCGATLIANFHLITAAHCFFGHFNHNDLYNVILGANNICEIPKPAQVFNTEEVIIHENYPYQQPFFDIAIIRLDRSALFFPKICLPPNFAKIPRITEVIGFGTTLPTSEKLSCALQTAPVTIYTREECLNTSKLTPLDLAPGTFCAGNLAGIIDTCQGDSGGPLFYEEGGRHYVLGIVSFGYDCAEPGYLGVYTDIPYFKDWIQTNTQTTHLDKNPSKWWPFVVNNFYNKRYTIIDPIEKDQKEDWKNIPQIVRTTMFL